MKSKGFTLFELIVVVALIGILTLMAAPMYTNLATNQNIEESSSNLISILNRARSKAIIEKRVIQVNLNNPDASSETIFNWNPVGASTLVKSTTTSIYFGANGFSQKSATDKDPTAELNFVVCKLAR